MVMLLFVIIKRGMMKKIKVYCIDVFWIDCIFLQQYQTAICRWYSKYHSQRLTDYLTLLFKCKCVVRHMWRKTLQKSKDAKTIYARETTFSPLSFIINIIQVIFVFLEIQHKETANFHRNINDDISYRLRNFSFKIWSNLHRKAIWTDMNPLKSRDNFLFCTPCWSIISSHLWLAHLLKLYQIQSVVSIQ